MKIINTLIATIILMVVSSACTTIKEVVKEGETKIEYRDRVRVNNVLSMIKDSIYINGDTVKIYRDRWRDRLVLQSDTIIKEVKVVEFVNKKIVEKLSLWDWLKAMFIGAVIYGIVSLVIKYWVKITTFFKF